MNDDNRRSTYGSLIWGLTLIVLGTLFFLDRFEVFSFHELFETYWPLFVVAAGVSRIVSGRRSVWSGLWVIAVGAWLQLTVLHIWGLTFSSSWPLLLIVMGGGIVLRSLFDPNYRRGSVTSEDRHD